MFDMLQAAGVDFSATLDLYAGTGALGIEALSRGSGSCDFVERHPRACEAIRRNVSAMSFQSRARVHCRPVREALRSLSGPYTLVMADPPYDDAEAADLLAEQAAPKLAQDGMLVFEHARRVAAPERLGPLRVVRERRHGDTVITIYRRHADLPMGAEQLAETPDEKQKGTP